jgi:DNA-binding NarL/FixJ family response regulator
MSTQSGFRPDQEAQIAEQYTSPERPTIKDLAREWRCSEPRIRAALSATETAVRPKGGGVGSKRARRPEIQADTRARHADIARLRGEGKSTAEIATALGLSHGGVSRILKRLFGPVPRATDEAILAALAEGSTVNAIVKTLGVGADRVKRLIAEQAEQAKQATRRPPAPKPTSTPRKLRTRRPGPLPLERTAPTAPRRPDLTARNAEILRRRRAGENPKAIAADLGLAVGTVYVVLEGADDLPPLRKGGGNALPRKGEPPATTEPRPAPVLLPRPPAQRRPAIRRAEGTVTATRTCHSCEIQIPVNDWADHLTKVHGYKGAAGLARTALDRYLERIRQQPEVEPQRQPDPPCPVCGLSPCPTPIVHARTARTWAQRGYQPRKKDAA